MATVFDVIVSAMQNIGAIAIEEVPTAAEAQSAFNDLNNMIQMWNTESLMIYDIVTEVFPYVAGQSVYTMGTGGNFNTNRPVRIEGAWTRDSQGNDYSMQVTENFEDYASIVSKYTTSTLPTILYDDGNFPLKNLTLWPVPSSGAFSLVLWSWKAIMSFSNLTDVLSLPPGYQTAIEFGLSVYISPKYGKPITPDLARMAAESKAQIKRINTVVDEMNFDDTLMGKGVAFNYFTGNAGNG